ncbi:hypothetical protein [Actinomycetospora chiangmaiensis]|uniref:hypothetical protein n=1 Tax=Actinomycetospora chiangmaiensis TaxID=402650 RepID=UPI0012FBC37E|nr:hypothetical protein [Actinomycetospora chiangmaiensis]
MDGAPCTITTRPADTRAVATGGAWIGTVNGANCDQPEPKGTLADTVAATANAATSALAGPVVLGPVSESTQEIAAQKAASDKAAKAAADKKAADQAAADKKAADEAALQQKQQQAARQGGAPAPLVAAPAALAAPPLAAPAALGAAGPLGALPPLAGVAPAGLASNLFSANAYDPGLLFGSPLGNAASALFSPKADTDVTTVSHAEVLPTTVGDGYGTPVTIGVIILACLVGFAVRHRIISRMKNRELPAAEYQPRHAAPDAEPEPETELHDAADEARTLVVLTRK